MFGSMLLTAGLALCNIAFTPGTPMARQKDFELEEPSFLTLATKHSSLGNNNAGIYSVSSFDPSFSDLFPPNIAALNPTPDRLLVKVLKDIDDDMIAEVKALKIVGQFVAAGMLEMQVATARKKVKGGADEEEGIYEAKPIIVMLKMPGRALTSTPGFIAAKDMETKRQMINDTLTMMCDRVAGLALEHGFVHRDNIIPNIMVISEGTKILDLNIIDWGGKFLSSIRDDVTWDDLMAWCHHRWAVPVWERALFIVIYRPKVYDSRLAAAASCGFSANLTRISLCTSTDANRQAREY
ncbi:hypothetical protein BT96DRAFT_936399 [Gymnopus androsaceus JB14]|uniref:Protein kinase domain-containing protein n=1 Tax=Gymnopus androsaceus JB14 TaxID=1447944 RepID=A0A6A4HZU3_9AGAR|nr:hypothetical protein BT96DRAFT_936399 [Gymnopus androsaceus JB14]